MIFDSFGALLLTVINPEYVKVLISLFVLVAVGLMSQQSRLIGFASPKANYFVGAIPRTNQGLTGMAGPLFETALDARGENAKLTQGNITSPARGHHYPFRHQLLGLPNEDK